MKKPSLKNSDEFKRLIKFYVSELKKRTGIGMMECKKILELVDYDVDLSEFYARYKGCAINVTKGTKEEWVMRHAKKCLGEKELDAKDMLKIYYSKEELIARWVCVLPDEASHQDLEQRALGGHVKTDKGYIWYPYWEAMREEK